MVDQGSGTQFRIPIVAKSVTTKFMIKLFDWLEYHHNVQPKNLTIDDGEANATDLKQYCHARNINLIPVATGSSQQNGVAENGVKITKNETRLKINTGIAILEKQIKKYTELSPDIIKQLWDEAMIASKFLKNAAPRFKKDAEPISPWEELTGKVKSIC